MRLDFLCKPNMPPMATLKNLIMPLCNYGYGSVAGLWDTPVTELNLMVQALKDKKVMQAYWRAKSFEYVANPKKYKG